MLKKFIRIFGGDPNKQEVNKLSGVVDEINALEDSYEKLSNQELTEKTVEFRKRLSEGETIDDLLVETFATVREAAKRTLGLRHYDVQLIGGISLHRGKIAEMRTGEGKTLVATLPVYLNALTGKGVHLITVNDYLARRDARWMAPIYNLLGLSVGVLQMAARTENGKKAFLIDLDKESPHEDQHQLRMVPRAEAYGADITYGTNSEFGFDYLRDNMAMSLEDRVQRGHNYAIIDEVDNVLIDEARTPLIISGPAQDEAELYVRMAQVVRQLRPEDYEINEKDKNVSLTEVGEGHVEEILGMPMRDPERPEDLTMEQARILGNLEQALRAQYLFHRNKEYLVQGGKVVIVDEFTGRLMPGRRWSDGLHQAVEAKEGVKVQSESVTYATITIQNYFRMYEKLAGMTGTAVTEAEEFLKIYNLEVLAIPTNLEYQAMRDDSDLIELEDRDEQGYKYAFYTRQEDAERKPLYFKRKDYPDMVYRTEEMKLRYIAQEILSNHSLGRPVLVGTTSVEMSERLSNRLRAEPLRRLALVMLLRQTWFEKHKYQEDGRQIEALQFLNKPLEQLEISEMRRLARELEMSFNPEDPGNLATLCRVYSLPERSLSRLSAGLQAGIPHEVLNARKHTEESQIITGAGAFGAVTIATNMAGRGVDIKLGGELAEEILAAVNRVLNRNNFEDPYNMTMQERRAALLKLQPDDYGIYDSEIQFFLQHMDEMEQVRQLGGLYVIGSERHDARRIDNQLRGRSARQGDPGASRFFLSMEDELMRLFGGQQADGFMQRLKIDDSLPLEVGLVSRLVEQAQTRVEGANFDMRKHLLEYDDVLNTQRATIYSQRNRIFTKEDLKDDVTEMLRVEVIRRVPEALKDEGGPWKLLAWLEQIQPPLPVEGEIFPSYTMRKVLKTLQKGLGNRFDKDSVRWTLLDIAQQALLAEQTHLLNSIQNLFETNQERLEQQLAEQLEVADNIFDGLDDEQDGSSLRSNDLVNELSTLTHVSIRLSPEAIRSLRQNPQIAEAEIRNQIESALVTQAVNRLIGAIERRMEESLEINVAQLPLDNWSALSNKILEVAENTLQARQTRYLGENGYITRDVDNMLSKISNLEEPQTLLRLLLIMPEGSRTTFDRKTHRRKLERTTRLVYFYLVAQLLESEEPDEIAADVLEHLEEAQEAIWRSWGQAEIARLGAASLTDLNEDMRQKISVALGDRADDALTTPLQNLSGETHRIVAAELGRKALTEVYRQVLLSVIAELWVDYLTQMESLRISIGLEAYAQRDPLVQYKNKAFELFQELLANMRLSVVSRMFTYRPREMSSVQTSIERGSSNELENGNSQVMDQQNAEVVAEKISARSQPTSSQQASVSASDQPQSGSGKRKRKRKR
ncbi:MAG TPA: hypothetical protein VLM80_08785 [Anaerolineales bacterium]|nr:hypothetical protein [Anaerolineales bacterium]